MDGQVERAVRELASRQFGSASFDQLLKAGVSRAKISRQAQDGIWVKMLPRVYRLWPHGDSFRQWIGEGVLWAGEDAVAAGTSAAYLLGLSGFGAGKREVLVPEGCKVAHEAVLVRRSSLLAEPDLLRREWPPRTAVGRTIVDLSESLTERKLEAVFESAWRKNRDALRWTFEALERVAGKDRLGLSMLEKLLRTRFEEPTDSELEAIATYEIRKAGFATPLLHVVMMEIAGSPEADFVWFDEKVILQTDGDTHRERRSWLWDTRVRRELGARGWQVVAATWQDFKHRPDEVIEALRIALQRTFTLRPGGSGEAA